MAYNPSVQPVLKNKKPAAPGQDQAQPQQGMQQAPQNFSQLQAQGMARPAPPQMMAPPPQQPMTNPQGGAQPQPNMEPMQRPPVATENPNQVQQQPNLENHLFNGVFGFQGYNPQTFQPQNVNPQQFFGQGFGGQVYNPNQHQVNPNQFSTGQGAYGGSSSSSTPGVGAMSFQAPGQGRVGVAQEQATYDALTNPSAYGSQQAMDTFNRLKGGIDESFGVNRKLIGEEMARRGLDASSIHGGRLGDLTIQHDRNLGDLAGTIATDQARTYGQDRAAALNAGMGYSGQQFDQALGGFNANLAGQGQAGTLNNASRYADIAGHQENRATNSQNFTQALQSGQFGREGQQLAFGQGMQKQGFNNDTRSQNLQNLLSGYGFNAGQQQQQFNQGMDVQQNNQNQMQQALQNLLGFGQQQFNNQLSTNQFNQGQQQGDFQQLMELLQLMGG